MDVTNSMLQAAIKKAVEAGLLPRHASNDEARINQELIRTVLQAAVEAVTFESNVRMAAEKPAARVSINGGC